MRSGMMSGTTSNMIIISLPSWLDVLRRIKQNQPYSHLGLHDSWLSKTCTDAGEIHASLQGQPALSNKHAIKVLCRKHQQSSTTANGNQQDQQSQ